jgi:DNA-binding response OmpR family regulator
MPAKDCSGEKSSAKANLPKSSKKGNGLKILIVDDEAHMVEIIKNRLLNEGFVPICAETGETAIRKAVEEKPDVILLDIQMSPLNGFEVCKKIRSYPELWGKAIIAITVFDMRDMEADYREASFDGYIRKPFSSDELLAKIQSLPVKKKD